MKFNSTKKTRISFFGALAAIFLLSVSGTYEVSSQNLDDGPEVGPGDDIVSIGPKQENLTAVPGVQSLVGPDDGPEVVPGDDSPVN